MNAADFEICAYCPRLCRHVCPVAVGTAREAATATAMATGALLVLRGAWTEEEGRAATSSCIGCGACTTHCKLHVPIGDRLAAFRARTVAPPAPAPLAPIEGDARLVCVITDGDWSGAWARANAVAAARLRTSDSLGHAAWRAGNTSVPGAVAAHFAGRDAVTASGSVAEVLAAAGVSVRRVAGPPADRHFHTCHGGALPSPDQLACCGRREGLPERDPDAARAVAEENVRLLAGAEVGCDDEECARWLVGHGAHVVGPTDALIEPRGD